MGEKMRPEDIVRLAVIGVAIFLAWNLWRGRALVPLYYMTWAVLVSLLASFIVQLEDFSAAIDLANIAAISLALAACTGSSALWQQEIGRDLEGTRVYAPFAFSDLRSWRGVLKAVDRIGAGPTALIYFLIFALAIAAVAVTVRPVGPAADRTAFVLSLAPTLLFAVLSAWYLYRGTRRLVPGA
jgi:hypothetical protein